jgi:hypothetical protein
MNVKEKTIPEARLDSKLVQLYNSSLNPFLGILGVIVYLLATDSHLGGADSGEMIGVSHNFGIAHPPGYPFYITVVKCFLLISPFGNIIYSCNLFSTLVFLLSVFVLYRSFLLLGQSRLAIFSVGAFYLFSPLNLKWMTVAEVFALHLFLASSGIFICCYIIKQDRLIPLSRALGLIAGLGACTHHSLAFFMPGFLMVYFYYWFQLPDIRVKVKELSLLCAFAILGLSFYLQPLLVSMFQADPVSSLGIELHSLKELMDFFFRRIYGTLNMSSSSGSAPSYFFWVIEYFKTSFFTLKGAGPLIFLGVLSFLGLGLRFEKRVLYYAVILWLTGSLTFILMIQIAPDEIIRQEIVPRMYFTVNLAFVFSAVLGLNIIFRKLQIGLKRSFDYISVVIAVVILTISFNNGIHSCHSQQVDVELQYGRDILDSCSPDSVLILNTDISGFSVFYLQTVEGVRSDVLSIIWPMVSREFYRNKIILEIFKRYDNYGNLKELFAENNLTSQLFLFSIIKAGVNIHTLYPEIEQHYPGEENLYKMFLQYSGISKQLYLTTEKKKKRQVDLSQVYSYLKWIEQIDLDQASLLEKIIIDKYIVLFKKIRQLIFSDPNIFSKELTAGLCNVMLKLDKEDPLNNFYFGLYYYRVKEESSAKLYLNSFLANSHSYKIPEARAAAESILNSQLSGFN